MKKKAIFLTVCLLVSFLFAGLPVRGEETDPQEEIARLQERVSALETELENAKKKSQTWKNMYYSLKEDYDKLTGADQAPVQEEDNQAKAKAVQAALALLSQGGYSKSGIITQLKNAGLSEEDAVFGAEHCGATWTEQALIKAKSFLASQSFSLDGLISQLLLAGFTSEEARAGAQMAYQESAADSGASYSMQNALKEAFSYLSGSDHYSRTGMIRKLKAAGYSEEDAIYAADTCGADWMEQARLQAAFYLRYQNMSHDELIQLLLEQGFTQEEAEYGFDQNGM